MRCTRWQAKKDLCKVAQHPLAVWGFNHHKNGCILPHRYMEIIDTLPLIDDYRGVYCRGLHYPLLSFTIYICVCIRQPLFKIFDVHP